jgi:hypothetical protein
MALGRQIACCLGLFAVGVLLLGCGSSDPTSAEIDPVIAGEFTAKLGVIRQFAEDGKCDRSIQALTFLKAAVDAESDQTGEQFTADLQEMLDRLNTQIEDQCQAPDETTVTTTDSSDTEPTTTDETTTTDPSTTTTTTTTSTTKSTTSTTTTPPTTTPGGDGPPNDPGGGVSPGGKKVGAAIDRPQHKGHGGPGKGNKHEQKKERGR